jgi:hypothetical protein
MTSRDLRTSARREGRGGSAEEPCRYQLLGDGSPGLQVVVLREPRTRARLMRGGRLMRVQASVPCSAPLTVKERPDIEAGTRFADDVRGLTVICVHGGAGSLTVDGHQLCVVTRPDGCNA